MSNSDESFIKALQQTLLGRLQVKLFQNISGVAESVPPPKDIRQFVLRAYETNIIFGRMIQHLLGLKECFIREIDKFEIDINIIKLLGALEQAPLLKPLFFEIHSCPKNLPSKLGVLISCEPLVDAGYVYTITFISEEEFPNH